MKDKEVINTEESESEKDIVIRQHFDKLKKKKKEEIQAQIF